MKHPKATAALEPFLSSPKRLLITGFSVLAAVLAIQTTSGIPAETSFSPIELSSNVVALMALAWALLQLRTYRAATELRTAWIKMACGMALLAVEGNVGGFFLLPTHSPDEMGISIAVWLLAAFLIFGGCRVFAPRRTVVTALKIGLAIQLVAQYLGWLGAIEQSDAGAGEALEYLNDMGELAAVLAYLFAMLLAEFAPLKSYRMPVESIGRKGRAIVRDYGLLDTRRYPTRAPWVRRAPLRWLAHAAIIGWYMVRIAPAVSRTGARSWAAQAVDLVRFGLKGVNPHSYYMLELFRRENRADADAFVTRVETKNGLTMRLQTHARRRAHAELTDKLAFTEICRSENLPVAPILAVVQDGAASFFADHDAFDRDLLVKERSGRGGRFTLVYRRVEPLVYRDEQGEALGVDELAMKLAFLGGGRRLIIQPKLENDGSIGFLANDALLTFRVVTCLDARGEPHVTHGLLRIMRRFEPSWPKFPEKEWGAAVDLETGELGALAGDAPATCGVRYPDHPVTGRAVEGVVVRRWCEIAELALDAHRAFAGRTIVGWDIALTPDGPMLLEGNSNMDFNFIQRCYGAPIGRSPLAALMHPFLNDVLADEKRRFTLH